MSEQNEVSTVEGAAVQTETAIVQDSKPVRAPLVPAFTEAKIAKIAPFNKWIEAKGHKMDEFKQGAEGKALRAALNAEYEAERATFSSVCAGALATAMASGAYVINYAAQNKSGVTTVKLAPKKANAKEKAALALLKSLGYDIKK